MFTAYCFTAEGQRLHEQDLAAEPEVFEYVGHHQLTYPRVVVIDKLSEMVVLEVRNSNIIFPESLQGREPWKETKKEES